jgi:hypothetical protein
MKNRLFSLTLAALAICSYGQQTTLISIRHVFKGTDFLHQTVVIDDSLSFRCTMLKYYLRERHGDEAEFYLISCDTTLRILSNGSPFYTGVEAQRQERGIGKGMLDPRHDMYWTWNTGYIQVKLEGELFRTGKPSEQLIWHLGGFAAGMNTTWPIAQNKNSSTTLICDMSAFIQKYASSTPHIMSPTPMVTEMTNDWTHSFYWDE